MSGKSKLGNAQLSSPVGSQQDNFEEGNISGLTEASYVPLTDGDENNSACLNVAQWMTYQGVQNTLGLFFALQHFEKEDSKVLLNDLDGLAIAATLDMLLQWRRYFYTDKAKTNERSEEFSKAVFKTLFDFPIIVGVIALANHAKIKEVEDFATVCFSILSAANAAFATYLLVKYKQQQAQMTPEALKSKNVAAGVQLTGSLVLLVAIALGLDKKVNAGKLIGLATPDQKTIATAGGVTYLALDWGHEIYKLLQFCSKPKNADTLTREGGMEERRLSNQSAVSITSNPLRFTATPAAGRILSTGEVERKESDETNEFNV